MEKLFTKILFVLTLNFVVITGMWAVDIGASAMISQVATGMPFEVQGLAFVRSPNTQYHLGLALVYLSFFFLSCAYVWSLIKSYGGKK